MNKSIGIWRHALKVGLVAATIMGLAGIAQAKSMYVIANLNTNPTPIESWDIGATGLITYQSTYQAPYQSGGGVGMAIDTDSKMLFVVYEFSNIIQIIDATTMTALGTATMPMASVRAAGIVYDHVRQRVYAAERNNPKVFSYDWDATAKTLTYVGTYNLSSTGGSRTWGLDVDEANGWLYVGGGSSTVNYYDVTSSFAKVGSISVGNSAVGIAVDTTRRLAYTTDNSYRLCRHNLDTSANYCLTGKRYRGVDVNPPTGWIYVTNGSSGNIVVYNENMVEQQASSNRGSITDLRVPSKEVAYNPLLLEKEDGLDDATECAGAGSQLTFTISYDSSGNNYDVHNTVLTDTLPSEMTFVSASNGGTYASGVVTWNLGTITAGSSGSVTLTVDINTGVAPGTVITNSTAIDSDQTPPTTVTEDTTVCTNQPPVAVCQDVTANANAQCVANASVNNGSYDPDGDPITIVENPTSPFSLGVTPVTLTITDDSAASDTCTGNVTVLDVTPPAVTCAGGVVEVGAGCEAPFTPTGSSTDNCSVASETWTPSTFTWPLGTNAVSLTAVDGSGNTATCTTSVTVIDTVAPEIQCNSLATITPPDAPISFTATSTDHCATTTTITGYDCWMLNGKGKRVDKTGSCVVSYNGATVTITDSGGVNDNIEWTVVATDSSGNTTTKTCALLVTNPGQGGGKQGGNQGVGNGPEQADPGNSNQGDPGNSNDEKGGTPGDPGKKGGKK